MSDHHGHHLARMTTEEAAAAVRSSPVVILPAGAFEQHGPGLPLATDTLRAEHVAAEAATALGGLAVVGPALPVGVSPHHLAFSGTVTLTTTTFAAVTREYTHSLYRHGWRKILVLTGHGGNGPALATVAQDLLTTHEDLQFAWTPLTPLAAHVVAAMGVSEVHGHSGEAETAQMLHVAPDLVHTARLTPGSTATAALDPLARLSRRPGHPSLTVRYDRLSLNGVLGDPTTATADQGRAVIDAAVSRLTTYITDWTAV
ncbi:creatininase family protein [Streptomyces avicenniae]|uniref:creatininase family protein n=1 Tax=Streptomyces avicenniae TaxID=500153 RepID=UPI000699FAB2|nr:creatininase family protein [Streptomyces avicenniae]